MTQNEKEQFKQHALRQFRDGKISLMDYLGFKYVCDMNGVQDVETYTLKLFSDMKIGVDPAEHPEIFTEWKEQGEQGRGDML